MRIPRSLAALALLACGGLGFAHIERLTLEEMVAVSDHAIYGTITAKHAFRVDHPVDGDGLYFTIVTVEGRSLIDGRDLVVDVAYNGGWIDEEDGAWYSEAPREEDTAVGKRVVVFYTWTDDMGGEVAANAIHAAHGGLFRTVDGPRGTVVLGQGVGFAVRHNTPLAVLDERITELAARRGEEAGR